MKNSFTTAIIFVLLIILCHVDAAQSQMTQQDTMYIEPTPVPIVIDGKADDAAWAEAKWFAIDQVWIPYGATPALGDFSGRFKLSWDENYLYILAEIVDDVISDDHANPLQNWWDDDCLEIFIDENRSKGDHERNYNAFAYHVSLFYDVIDLHTNGSPINLKSNLEVVMDTLPGNTYIWEVAMKNYSNLFNPSNPEASRVLLSHNKLMGFTLAYCDNDQTTSRENFFGSMYMPQAVANDNYKTANYFGTLLLIDSAQTDVGAVDNPGGLWNIYPNPSTGYINIDNAENALLEIFSVDGRLIRSEFIEGTVFNIDISYLPRGSYFIALTDDKERMTKMIILD